MNKGRSSIQKWIARLSLLAAAALVYIPHAQAQQGNPEVYIDMGVLQGLGTEPAPAPAPIKLKPPAPKPPAAQGMPSLIAPTVAPDQPPPSTVTSNPQPVIAKPAPVVKKTEPAPVKEAVSKAPVVPAEKPSTPKPAKTPIVSKAPELPPDNLPLKSAPPPPVPALVVAQQPAAVLEPIKPIAVTDPVPVLPEIVEEIKPTAATKPAETVDEPPKVTSFPLEQKIRKETTDPAANNTSRPVPVRSGIAGNLKDVVPSRPAPDLDPATASEQASVPVRDLTEEPETTEKVEAQPAPKKDVAVTKKADATKAPVIPGRKPANPNADIKAVEAPPSEPVSVVENAPESKPVEIVGEATKEAPIIPPRRPDNVQKAPPELVAELRAREAAKEVEAAGTSAKPKAAIDLSNPPPPPGPRGKKNMPAVAKAPVDAEPLTEQTIKLAAESDPLLDRLVEKDKASLVATIESMVAEREDGKPLPDNKKQEKREQGTSIVKAEPMQRPYNVYRPKKEEAPAAASAPEEIKTAELTEASTPTITPRPPEPRSQDEEAYVSVPFSQGLTEIDTKITNEIETRLLPLLNDNPGWKLQIQAFASPVKDGASSARKASLARAMSVRTYLLSKGIEANRMDIRALGAESDRDPMDRVDMIVFDPSKRG